MEIRQDRESAVPQPLIDLLKNKHKTVRSDHKYICTSVMLEIARIAFENGEKPVVLRAISAECKDGNIEMLVPKIHEGGVEWGAHIVCAIGNMVLDPIIGEPINREDYVREAFDKLAVLNETHSSKSLKKILDRI